MYSQFKRSRLSYDQMKWQPLPLSPRGYQDFALLYPSQLESLRKCFLQREPGHVMDPQDFRIEVEDLANNNGVGTLTIPPQECGQE